eukprot:Clim_evm51s235 gene=Clim_evmTU51s235
MRLSVVNVLLLLVTTFAVAGEEIVRAPIGSSDYKSTKHVHSDHAKSHQKWRKKISQNEYPANLKNLLTAEFIEEVDYQHDFTSSNAVPLSEEPEGLYKGYGEARENSATFPSEASEMLETGLHALNTGFDLMASGNDEEADLEISRGYEILMEAAKLGHPTAKAHVVEEVLLGRYLTRDYDLAREWAEELAEMGSPSAHQVLSFLAGNGIARESSEAEAVLHALFGAMGGDPFARLQMGYRYKAGVGVPESCHTSYRFFHLVAQEVVSGMLMMGSDDIYQIDDGPVRLYEYQNPNVLSADDITQYYTYNAERGDPNAQAIMGQLYYYGMHGIPIDMPEAQRFFEGAVLDDPENMNARAFLGRMHLEGNAVNADLQVAREHIDIAARNGNSMAMNLQAKMKLYGHGQEKDVAGAVKILQKAADNGSSNAALNLGYLYFHGIGVAPDHAKAKDLFTAASHHGNMLAVYNLAQMSYHGTGTPRMCILALAYIRKVAYRCAALNLFRSAERAFENGDYEQSFLIYALLADMGYEVAQANAGFVVAEHGNSFLGDESQIYNRANMYWSRAGDQTNTYGLVQMGDSYYYGRGVEKNTHRAISFYRKAISPTYERLFDTMMTSQALYNLAYMYEKGEGFTVDLASAKHHYERALDVSPYARWASWAALYKLRMAEYVGNIPSNWDIYVLGILSVLLLLQLSYRYNRYSF